jgi:hypothetical protein
MTALTLGDYLAQVQSLVHDSTESAWTRREMFARINDARKDVSRDMQCVRQSVRNVQLIRNEEIYNWEGAVVGARIINRGQNYSGHIADVTFGPPPPDGEQAEAFALVKQHHPFFEPHEHEHHDRDKDEIKPGQIEHIFMRRWGSLYTQVPTLTISDPEGTGSGATAVPIVMFNVINVLSISNLWNTLRYSLSFKTFGIFNAWARSLQAQGFRAYPGMFSIKSGENLVYLSPVPDQTYFSEWDVIKQAAPLVGLTDIDRDIKDPFAQAVQFKAAEYLLMKHQDFNQASFYAQKYDASVPRIIAGSGGVRITNPYNRAAFMKMRRA